MLCDFESAAYALATYDGFESRVWTTDTLDAATNAYTTSSDLYLVGRLLQVCVSY
jgi:hypothetical protein